LQSGIEVEALLCFQHWLENKVDKPRLALLIDADNIPFRLLSDILRHVESLGNSIVRAIFGDFSENRNSEWIVGVREFALEPVLQISGGKGKNSTDIAMTIRAMDLFYSGQVDGFCIASSDRDFLPLAMRLRQHGKQVYGFGESKTDAAFRKNCTKFFVLDGERKAVVEPPKPGIKLHPQIATLIRTLSAKNPAGAVPLSFLATAITNEVPKLAPTICGKGKFLKNLRKTGEVNVIGEGSTLSIQLRRAAPANHE